MWWMPWH